MRRIARRDANQPEIVDSLRKAGFTVALLHQVGGGCPDILVGTNRHNILMEIKDPSQPPSNRKLTKDQIIFHRDWRGPVYVIETAEQAINLAVKYKNL